MMRPALLKPLAPGALLVGLLMGACAAPAPTAAPLPSPTSTPVTCVSGTLTPTSEDAVKKQYNAPPAMTLKPNCTYTATVSTTQGDLVIELFAAEAPKTVNSFVFLAREGFYDGVIFHRVIKGFMVQTGDPTGTGRGGPGYQFVNEPVTRPYNRGIVAMANAGPNTNGSQFFIMHQNYGLRPDYTIFGQVVQGLEVLDALANTPVAAGAGGEVSKPVTPPSMLKIKIAVGASQGAGEAGGSSGR